MPRLLPKAGGTDAFGLLPQSILVICAVPIPMGKPSPTRYPARTEICPWTPRLIPFELVPFLKSFCLLDHTVSNIYC